MVCLAGFLTACDNAADEETFTVSPLAEKFGFSKEHPLVMGMNTSYAPLQYVDDKGVPCGYDVEFTKILMKRMGIPFAFSPNHWNEMSPGIIGGKYDMGMLVYSPYRKELTNYSRAVFLMYYQIAYRSKDYTNFDFRHLKGKKIAYMKSRPIGLMLKDAEADGVPITDLGEAFADLGNGKYDGLICYRFQARHNINRLHLQDQIATDELSLEPREYCYASSKPELIEAINAELERMEAEGIIDEVYGQDVAERFGVIKIPVWIWYLLVALVLLFLTVYSINRYRYGQHMKLANKKLQHAYDQMAEKNQELQVANARAEESTKMKSAFIKQISHEIRTPLNVVSGYAQVLATPGVTLSQQELENTSTQMMENTNRITGLVNKMLELAEVSSHSVLVRDDQVSARQIALQAVENTCIGDAAHLDFELRLESGSDETFMTHLRSASRCLELLLDNAMKFTHPAEAYRSQQKTDHHEHVTLIASCHDGLVRFAVEDTGIGVPAEEAEHIFDEFVQLDEYYDGTGIGLAVARSLARRLGGDVYLDTTFTPGARFIMELKK